MMSLIDRRNRRSWAGKGAISLLRRMIVLGAALLGGQVWADGEDPVLIASAGVVSRHIYRGVERSGDAWQVALDGAVDGWRGQFWSSRPLDSTAPGELRSRIGYVWAVTPSLSIEVSGTHFWYVDAPIKGAAGHSFEGNVRMTWTDRNRWRWGLESGYDIRFHSRVLEGSVEYDQPLPRWGTYLEGRLYAGQNMADEVLPDAAGTDVRDSYGYWGADFRLPYRISWHTTVAVSAHHTQTVNQNQYWSPQLIGSGGRTWFGLSASYEF